MVAIRSIGIYYDYDKMCEDLCKQYVEVAESTI